MFSVSLLLTFQSSCTKKCVYGVRSLRYDQLERVSADAAPSRKSANAFLVYSPLKVKLPLLCCELRKFVCSQFACTPNLMLCAPLVQVRSPESCRSSEASEFGTFEIPSPVYPVMEIEENPG